MKIVKLGGSVITLKDDYLNARVDTITRLCKELARSGQDLVVVCGAGSFGHIKAEEYKLHKGRDPGVKDQDKGLALVQKDVRSLNMIVLDAMMKEGLNPVSIPPSMVAINNNGKLFQLRSELFKWFAELGLTPVTFGDVVLDDDLGFSICSGDWLLKRLAEDLGIKDTVFVADTDGVFSADPKSDPGAELIKEMTTSQGGDIDFKGKGKPDVTGGMGAKVKVALEMTMLGISTHILNGNEENRLFNALTGQEVVSTFIRGGD
jgi:isopentenyl phosphate kinase